MGILGEGFEIGETTESLELLRILGGGGDWVMAETCGESGCIRGSDVWRSSIWGREGLSVGGEISSE